MFTRCLRLILLFLCIAIGSQIGLTLGQPHQEPGELSIQVIGEIRPLKRLKVLPQIIGKP